MFADGSTGGQRVLLHLQRKNPLGGKFQTKTAVCKTQEKIVARTFRRSEFYL